MPISEEDQEFLISEAWRLRQDAILRGELRLAMRVDPILLSAREILSVAENLANKRPPKSRKVPNLDNLNLVRTDDQEARGVGSISSPVD
jgi:hypothetical protein